MSRRLETYITILGDVFETVILSWKCLVHDVSAYAASQNQEVIRSCDFKEYIMLMPNYRISKK